MLPVIRTFIILEILIYVHSKTRFELRQLYVLSVLVAMVGSLVGSVNIDYYREINDFFNGAQRFVSSGSTIASVAITERNSSLFSQPATAGLFWLIAFSFFMCYNRVRIKLLAIPVFFCGIITKSSIFEYGVYLVLLYFIVPNILVKKHVLKLIVILPSLLILIVIIIYRTDDKSALLYMLAGGRYVAGSNFMEVFLNMSFVELLLGMDVSGTKKVLGDSSILSKIILGGIVFYALYVTSIYVYLDKIISYHLPQNRKFFLLIVLIFCLSELGFNAFSQPGLYNAAFIPLVIGLRNE